MKTNKIIHKLRQIQLGKLELISPILNKKIITLNETYSDRNANNNSLQMALTHYNKYAILIIIIDSWWEGVLCNTK